MSADVVSIESRLARQRIDGQPWSEELVELISEIARIYDEIAQIDEIAERHKRNALQRLRRRYHRWEIQQRYKERKRQGLVTTRPKEKESHAKHTRRTIRARSSARKRR